MTVTEKVVSAESAALVPVIVKTNCPEVPDIEVDDVLLPLLQPVAALRARASSIRPASAGSWRERLAKGSRQRKKPSTPAVAA